MFIQDVRPVGIRKENMVGEAFTLRYIPSREDLDGIEVFKDPAHPQRKAVEDCPPGHVMVIDSRKDPRAASAGSIAWQPRECDRRSRPSTRGLRF